MIPIVYLAGPWSDRDLARRTAARIEAWGYAISEAWWDHEDSTTPEELQRQALKDLDGVLRADIFVVLQAAKSEGKATETGIAIGNGMPIIVVRYDGVEATNIFHHLPGVVIVFSADEGLHDALEIVKAGL